MRRHAPAIAFLVAFVLLGPAPSLGHTSHATVPLPAEGGGTDASAGPVAVGFTATVAGVAALLAARRRRRALVLGLALLLGIFAFESGRHAAHHLGQAPCQVASALSHLAGATHGVVTVETAAVLVWAPRAASPPPASVSRPLAPDAGRAPPVLPS